ncbi:hypothetical protein [Flavobacterium sp. JP2137]|uniref:hypothetical protein n=1 Tax=Flavobacterium sp. JP2137 TaxID=3414510 RepID=UPI003D30124E
MNKSPYLLLAVVAVFGSACSNGDDNVQDHADAVFESPYEALNSFDELGSHVWKYEGAKIGDRKFGAMSNGNCLRNNKMIFYLGTTSAKNDSIYYDSYKKSTVRETDCGLDFDRTFRKVRMSSKGKMYADIYDYNVRIDTHRQTQVITVDTIRKNYFKGNMEIGFQSGMLRVEDKFTLYSGDEKVYLYFKKQ